MSILDISVKQNASILEMDDSVHIGHSRFMKNAIDRLKDERDWTYEDVGQRIGHTASTVSKLAKGQLRIKVEQLIKLADAFGCSIDEVVGRPPSSPPLDVALLRKYILEALKYTGGAIPSEQLADMTIRGYLESLPIEKFREHLDFARPVTESANTR